jgi:hypothetical protein
MNSNVAARLSLVSLGPTRSRRSQSREPLTDADKRRVKVDHTAPRRAPLC